MFQRLQLARVLRGLSDRPLPRDTGAMLPPAPVRSSTVSHQTRLTALIVALCLAGVAVTSHAGEAFDTFTGHNTTPALALSRIAARPQPRSGSKRS